VDLRNSDEKLLQYAERNLAEFIIKEISAQEGVTVSSKKLVRFELVLFDKNILNCIKQTSIDLGYSTCRMTSGAGHDAQMMSRICPSAMIFVPSKNGISHNPAEFTMPEDLEYGANVLLNSVLNLVCY
jgi:beta-ureidopropionase / N-carbamoyl-L-amino-acid hydrolase